MNVTRTELNEALKTRISHLVYPLNTVLDESIGAVLWFGSQGSGNVDDIDYSSNCRVRKRVFSMRAVSNYFSRIQVKVKISIFFSTDDRFC